MIKESMNAGTEAMEYFTDYFSQFQKVMVHQQMSAPPHFYQSQQQQQHLMAPPNLPNLHHNPYAPPMFNNRKSSMLDIPGASFMAQLQPPPPPPQQQSSYPSALNPMLHNPFQLQRGSVRQSRKDMFPSFPPPPPIVAPPPPQLPALPRMPHSAGAGPSMTRNQMPHYPTMSPLYPSTVASHAAAAAARAAAANQMNMSKIFDVAPPKLYGEHGIYDTAANALQKMLAASSNGGGGRPFPMRSGSKQPNHRMSQFYELEPDDVSDFKRFLLEQYMMEKKKRLKEAFNSYMATMPRRGSIGAFGNEYWPNLMTDSGLFGGENPAGAAAAAVDDHGLDYMEHRFAKNLLRCKTGGMGNNKRRYIKF